jgi:hypothetical protein
MCHTRVTSQRKYESVSHRVTWLTGIRVEFLQPGRTGQGRMNEAVSPRRCPGSPPRFFMPGYCSRAIGYYFSREPLRVAEKTREKHVLHIIRLYEQLRKKKATPEEVASTLGLYVKRWQCWAQAGLGSTPVPRLARQSPIAGNHKVAE